jgi:hypothetical protein
MTRKTAILLICAALAAGCNRSSKTAQRGDPNYQVVEEGQASGVTSTINAPGETPPPITDTAYDTTTNFTLPDNPAPLGTLPPGTVAGTLPTYTPYPATPRPRPAAPPPMSSATAPPPQAQPQPAPPPTDTAVTDEVLPPTDTTASQPPPPEEKKEEGEQTDTAKTDTSSTTTTTTNPPPPTPPI